MYASIRLPAVRFDYLFTFFRLSSICWFLVRLLESKSHWLTSTASPSYSSLGQMVCGLLSEAGQLLRPFTSNRGNRRYDGLGSLYVLLIPM